MEGQKNGLKAVTSSRRKATARVNKAAVDKDVRLRATSERRVSPPDPPRPPTNPRLALSSPSPIMMLTHRLRLPRFVVFF